MSEVNSSFNLQLATSYLLYVDTAPTPNIDSPTVFRLESVTDLPEFKLEVLIAITDLTEKEDRNSGFESKQETNNRCFFPKQK